MDRAHGRRAEGTAHRVETPVQPRQQVSGGRRPGPGIRCGQGKVNHHRTVSEYFTPEAEVERLGVARLVRFATGLEAPRDLVSCLDWALSRYRQISETDVLKWQRDRARNLGLTEEEA